MEITSLQCGKLHLIEVQTLMLTFLNPLFDVVEAKKEGIWLNLKVKLLQVNEVSLNDVVLPLRIHLIENN